MFQHIEVTDGRVWLKASGIGFFCGDLPEAKQKLVYAWKTKPSWFIVGAQDQTANPELERFVAKRMGATTVELRPSHVPMLSQPHAVLDVIRNAARTIEKFKAA